MSVTEPLPNENAPGSADAASSPAEGRTPDGHRHTAAAESPPVAQNEAGATVPPLSDENTSAAALTGSEVSTAAETDPSRGTAGPLEPMAGDSPGERKDAPSTDSAADTETPADAEPAVHPPGPSPAQTAAQLAERFPALFAGPPKPIKLRIQADIQARAPGVFTKRLMSIVLSRHTTTTPYLKALVAQTQRYDLDGQPAGEIAPEHKQAAQEELARRRQIVDARRAAERAAQASRADAHTGPRHGTHARRRPGSADSATHLQANETVSPAPFPPAPATFRERPMQEQRSTRPQRSAGERSAVPGRRQDRPERQGRSPRPLHAAQGHEATPRGSVPQRGHRGPQAQRQNPLGGRAVTTPPREWTPSDPQQRERAVLLRAWESSSLTKANFCALKRLTEAEFDAQLEQARQERSAARSG